MAQAAGRSAAAVFTPFFMASLLIVDDLIPIHEMLGAVLHPTGHQTAFATDGEKALAMYKAGQFDLVLADIDMKPMDGITLLKKLKAYDETAVLIIMTAYASTESAVKALQYGAFDYLQKPFKVDELLQALQRGLIYRQALLARAAVIEASPGVLAADFESRLVGESQKNKRLIAQLKKLAGARTPILITGEKGCGHEIAAELLHAATSPLISIDCQLSSMASLRSGLLGENGLGGTWVQQAKGGTLFLLHLQALPLEAQAELVSVIRNNTHNVHLLCATEVDLEKLAEEGLFNEELFYRIAALLVQLPALRERVEDIPALIKDVASQTTNPQFDARQVEFSAEALQVLANYSWPGNLTEFRQVIASLLTTTETRVISASQLPLRIHELKHWPTLAAYLADHEKQYIARLLHASGGDKVRAAAALAIDVSRLN
jgi:two-component system response regulator HydG